jgi:putative phage-type endonuclease
MEIINCEQGTPEWFEARKGKVTGSHAQAIATMGKGLDTYVVELMAEMFSSKEKEHFTNEHTERGNELEAQARSIYELETGNVVEQIGFAKYNEFVGSSPDGLINPYGLAEIKCPEDKVYFKILMGGRAEIDTGYIWQMQMNMLILDREWCDLIYYNPNFKKSTCIFRIERDAEKVKKLLSGFIVAEEKIKLYKNIYQNL